MTAPPPSPSPLAAAATWRAVELIEEDGPLDDTAALRQAIATHPDDRGRLLERARLLGQRLGLDREWTRWQRLDGWVLLGLALAVAAASWLLAQGLLGGGRQINAVAALFSLLGLHALSWLLWFCSLFVRWGGNSGGGALLGRLALRLTARLPLDRGPHALQLARATSDVLVRARLAPWVFGGISHLAWSLSFTVLLIGLLAGFALRAYTLGWETTILAPDTLAGFVHASGWLPALLGFPVPDAHALQTAGMNGADPRAWAWWLIGSVLVYGLGLRLLSAACCVLAWRKGMRRLPPDLATPYARRLLARIAALAPVQVLDEERPHTETQTVPYAASSPAEGVRSIGFELPPELDWPGPAIAGSQAERESFLQSLAAAPPRRLLIACHAPSTPDRGTARFLREAAALAGETALLPLGPAADAQRWRTWLAASGLASIAIHDDTASAQAWLEAVGATAP
ncbi:DUF2868 domain-containing protein [Paucibacter sp. R3-3]|uniref:DUF2868 domain-containing protein n=1 Tax=Roseateles agri TaxID=3098619 RepID=A0ABU5DF11_9BURK|nr:DUF2868 domain-containing protein [Paucibacter sp. R3-3]MDY0744406.1 DUF2868 domain-containing protein [Paucibacter sp. R3-3]